ncbi:MAG: aspartate aminotransferase, partial [Eubacteriales bacterium]|nr:aspartate aminotransferase [Eubacteriales bacterium]
MKPLSHIAEQVNESSTLAMDALYKQMKADGIDVLGFAAGEPDFPTPDRIKLAAIEAIINNDTKYTPATGTLVLKKAICQRLKADCGVE